MTLNYKRRQVAVNILLCFLVLVATFSCGYLLGQQARPGLRIVVFPVTVSGALLVFYLFTKEILRYRSREAEASRNAAENLHDLKNNFFQHISHDIRGAYFGVGSICAVIHDKVSSGQPVPPHVAESLLQASQNYKYMLNHFLEFSKFKMGTVDEIVEGLIDIPAEVGHIIEVNKFLALEKNIHVELQVDEQFPGTLLTDRLKISRIFNNIFVNSLKFSPLGSTVRVRLDVSDGVWVMTVIDEGKGFHPDQLARIFEPYATSRSPENPEGIGLGLYITHYLTRLLGGEIRIHSIPAAGATVELRFPR